MARILVTGGCGYIGSHTIVDLIDSGHEVISIDNFSRSNPVILEGIREITGRPVENHNVDLADRSATTELANQLGAGASIDGIIHFAAYKSVPESVEKPLLYYENNIGSLLNILRLAAHLHIPNFVFSSSCTVYGQPDELPVDEDTPAGKAESPYGMTKQIGERIIRDQVTAGNGLKAVLLRYFNPVGAHPSAGIGELPIGIPNNLVPYITQTAAGIREELTIFGDDYDTRDGSCVRDYVHVMDIASAHTRAVEYMLKGEQSGNCTVFNLGTGNGVTVKEVVEAFSKANDVDLPYKFGPRRPGDVEAVYSDNRKAIDELGWKIKYDLEDMMRSAWEWQQRISN